MDDRWIGWSTELVDHNRRIKFRLSWLDNWTVFLKHFYRSLESSRERPLRNTVNVWDHCRDASNSSDGPSVATVSRRCFHFLQHEIFLRAEVVECGEHKICCATSFKPLCLLLGLKNKANEALNFFLHSQLLSRSDCRIPGPGVGVFEEREILQWVYCYSMYVNHWAGYSAI